MGKDKKYLENPSLQAFSSTVSQKSDLVVDALWKSPKALLATLAQVSANAPLVILTTDFSIFDDLAYFLEKKPLEFPAWEALPEEEIPPSPDIVGERYKILEEIQKADAPIILTSLNALLQKLIDPAKLLFLHLKIGEAYSFETLSHTLSQMGYHRRSIAADKGEFALRGGIIDIFPVSSFEPYRLEFWEDELESIRKYDPISQVSIEKVGELTITPAQELEFVHKEKHLSTFFDYLKHPPLIIFDEFDKIEDHYVSFKPKSSPSFMAIAEFFEKISSFQKIYFSNEPLESLSEIKFLRSDASSQLISFESFGLSLEAHRMRHPFYPLLPIFCPPERPLDDFSANDFLMALKEFSKSEEIAIHFVSNSSTEETKIREMEIEGEYEIGYLSSGFFLQNPAYALVSTAELNHKHKVRRQKQRSSYHGTALEMAALTPGEAVVHIQSGIGRYIGIEKRPNHLGIETEFMILEYADSAKLYVPMEQANLISKYIGVEESTPQLHSLGSSRWKHAREKTEQAILGYAKDLLELQAKRALLGGFAYPADSDIMKDFSEEFPYEETPDQLLAIGQIKEDMQSVRTMDRLVCGDVGYGKTEVAMRAAFKAVVDGGKQVAVLVPTTVLAMQHYETFRDRMANFPINVKAISRFFKPKEVQKTLEGVASGEVDILIGTHRIVSKDVNFKNLGLVVIDEEQRFGVRAKEHLKKLREDVDCLTLSATPIPRTLYLSLTGTRDLSIINTPPEDRLPIQSIVCSTNDDLIKNALLRELARNGQAFFIHNRVETIFGAADKIRTLLPTAKIVVGHGQMSPNELDVVFHTFKSGEADILVSTSIIENGIDIPNANTMLIDRADRFGLAELYQMRGRVGRWNRKAYCYFLVPNMRELSEMSRKRLAALTTSSGHGGGMKIAMHDLEIRGAGNILGVQQSGHVAAIGFHLYCKLLKKTIASLQKNERPIFFDDLKIELPFDARLPDTYIPETALRMEIYQRLGDSETPEEVDKLILEVKDRFGPLPKEVEWLQSIAKIRLFAQKNRFSLLKMTKVIFLAEQSHGKKEKISKKVLIKFPKSPQELEKTVFDVLRANFPLRLISLENHGF